MATNTDQSSYRSPAFADAKPELTAPGATPERLAHLAEQGFVIINDFVDSPWIPVLREAGRRITQACVPDQPYSTIDSSKGYVHRMKADEPWAIRGLIHPAFNEPSFAEFHGSPEFLNFVNSWCGLQPEDMTLSTLLLVQSPTQRSQTRLAPRPNLVGHRKEIRRPGKGSQGRPRGLLRGG
jgi:hypothetical protein